MVRLLRVEDDATVDAMIGESSPRTIRARVTVLVNTLLLRFIVTLRFFAIIHLHHHGHGFRLISRETASFDRCLIVFFEMGLLPFHVF